MPHPEDATGRQDFSGEVRKHNSLALRLLFATLGGTCVLLGVAGIFLPGLPTTPFLLLAAAFFARSSSRIYNWLLNHATLGPVILEWRRYRSLPYRIKRIALVLIALSFLVSIVFFIPYWQGQLLMGCAGLILWLWIYRLPSRDGPGQSMTCPCPWQNDMANSQRRSGKAPE